MGAKREQWLGGRRPKVSCIIPAYNEGPRIDAVLCAVEHHPWVDQLIVVNDGSSDDTAEVVRKHPLAQLIDLHPNGGKSNAVRRGIEAAAHDYIMMLDADLIGLTHDDLCALLRPVLLGTTDVALSLRRNSHPICRMMGLDYITGERVFHKSSLGDAARLSSLRGYGLEVYFNEEIIRRRLRIDSVYWPGVRFVHKRGKQGFVRSFVAQVDMVLQIIRTVGFWRVFYQHRHMLRLMKHA